MNINFKQKIQIKLQGRLSILIRNAYSQDDFVMIKRFVCVYSQYIYMFSKGPS